jgi:flagellar biosynthetic protein FlhB
MAEQNKDQEKTEEATSKKRDDARKKGQVAKSQEAASVSVLLVGLIVFWFGSAGAVRQVTALTRWLFNESGRFNLDANTTHHLMVGLLYKVFILIFPLFLAILLIAFLVNYLQVGFVLSTEAILPKLSKISPIKGLQKLISIRSLVELMKNIFKIFIVGLVVYLTVKGESSLFIPLPDQSVGGIMICIAGVAFKIVLRVCLVLIVLALLDYIYQRWEFEKSLKMTKQEIKDEAKQTEGDPLIKARIKQLQREAARKRMMAAVPQADVVITNPTHLAVALKYDQTSMAVPKVVAKGADFIAENIKAIAKENNVPIINNKPLARVLYKMVDVDEVIPEQLYRAVAEVLAFIYNMKMKKTN